VVANGCDDFVHFLAKVSQCPLPGWKTDPYLKKVLPVTKPVLSITYEQIDRWIASIQSTLIQESFVCIVGILRGGGPLALMASHATGVPVAFVRYDRATRRAVWDSSIPIPTHGSKILLCEDIAGAGNTLSDCLEYLQGLELEIKTLTAGFDDLSLLHPDYGIDGRGYHLLFPWERQSYTKSYRTHWLQTEGGRTGSMDDDHQYNTYAIDLDGILLPDIERNCYEADLEKALGIRDSLSPFDNLPAQKRIKVIVTGRPEMDRGRTKSWLRKHGFGDVELVMRNTTEFGDSPSQVAAHKAAATLRLACTHFVESDPVQAVLVATAAPLLRVIWWDAKAGKAKLIGANDCEHFSLQSF
jgi:hypoxanthine phosphoribosyltransferase